MVLIKTVLQALPTYLRSCFELPSSLIKEMEGILVNLFWHDGGEGKVHWIAWDRLFNRTKEHGLRFQRMREYSITMRAKLAWRVVM
ncbi:UNVERIFIED_CONTAM: hypothetical protein Sindi_1721900 [Sesamum indicum]